MADRRGMGERRRYLVEPGEVTSKFDGARHFISAQQLIRMYRVNPKDCLIIDYTNPASLHRVQPGSNDVHLFPRSDGNYTLPADLRNDP